MLKITTERLTGARNAAQNPIWIDTSSGLARAAKAWSRQAGSQRTNSPDTAMGMLAIDTEFVRERTYYANLGLVQISDAQTVWLLDVPALDNLDPLADLFSNPDIIKVLHSAGEDLEILWQHLDVVPEPFFDSQVAAAMLGFPLQLAYEHLITDLLPIELSKGPSRSNWLQRPLSDAQIIYASNDVAYLPLAADILYHRLQASERLSWHQQDMLQLTRQAQQPVNLDALYLRVKGAGRLNGYGLAYLQRLARWRDQQARERNLPRSFVLNDTELVEVARLATDRLARQTSVVAQDIQQLAELHPKSARRYAETLPQLLADEPAAPLPELPGRPAPAERQQLSALQATVKSVASELNVEPTLLASKRILQALQNSYSTTDDSMLLGGWRAGLLNNRLRTVLNAG